MRRSLVNKILNPRSKLLIYGLIEQFPNLSPKEISNIVNVSEDKIEKMFKKGYIIMPSKLNKK